MSHRFLPAEWDPQSLLCLTWPHSSTDWNCCFKAITQTYCRWVHAIIRFQPVLILCQDQTHQQEIQFALREQQINDFKNVFFIQIPTNDTWIRDYGPIVLFEQQQPIVCKYTFNGWGEQFTHTLDNQASYRLQEHGWLPDTQFEEVDLVLEGGNIDTNGNGHLLSNFTSLVLNARQSFDKNELTKQLCDNLGVQHIHWLEVPGLHGDDTHGHIDTLCRFIDVNTIVYCSESGDDDPSRDTLKSLENQLQQIADQAGFQLCPIPRPALIDRALAASYINFVLINNALLVPQYGHPLDDVAMEKFTSLAGNREVVGIDARTLIQQSGALHCASMHIPKNEFHENRLRTTAK